MIHQSKMNARDVVIAFLFAALKNLFSIHKFEYISFVYIVILLCLFIKFFIVNVPAYNIHKYL